MAISTSPLGRPSERSPKGGNLRGFLSDAANEVLLHLDCSAKIHKKAGTRQFGVTKHVGETTATRQRTNETLAVHQIATQQPKIPLAVSFRLLLHTSPRALCFNHLSAVAAAGVFLLKLGSRPFRPDRPTRFRSLQIEYFASGAAKFGLASLFGTAGRITLTACLGHSSGCPSRYPRYRAAFHSSGSGTAS